MRRTSSLDLSRFALPAIIALIIVSLMAYFVGGESASPSGSGESVDVTPASGALVEVLLAGSNTHSIALTQKLYASDEGVRVSSGSAHITSAGGAEIFTEGLTIVQYAGAATGLQTFALENGSLWSESRGESILVTTSHAAITIANESVVSVYKWALASRVYVLKGSAQVRVWDKSAELGAGQQIEITAADTKSPDALTSRVVALGSDIRSTLLYRERGGEAYFGSSTLAQSGANIVLSWALSSSGLTLSGVAPLPAATTLSISSPQDETEISGSLTDIEGVYPSGTSRVMIGSVKASLNTENSTFLFKEYELPLKENDIVVKAYGTDGAVIAKATITLRSKSAPSANKPKPITYQISPKDFSIIAPSTPSGTNTYRTTERKVKIQGRVTPGKISYIVVNNFRLTRFPKGGTLWEYNADMDYSKNLTTGYNQYMIRYYDENDVKVFEQPFVIVREDKSPVSSETR